LGDLIMADGNMGDANEQDSYLEMKKLEQELEFLNI